MKGTRPFLNLRGVEADWFFTNRLSALIIHQIFFARAISLNASRDAAKTGEYQMIFPSFRTLRFTHLDIICSSKLTVFLELRSRKTMRFSEQIMSADKYPCIFSRQIEAIVYIS